MPRRLTCAGVDRLIYQRYNSPAITDIVIYQYVIANRIRYATANRIANNTSAPVVIIRSQIPGAVLVFRVIAAPGLRGVSAADK